MDYKKKVDDLVSSEFMNHAICVACIPIAIMRLFVRIMAVFFSLGAVILSDMIAVVTGRVYSQDVDLAYLPTESFVSAEDNGLPYWYLRLTLYAMDDITQFHSWAFENVTRHFEEDDDDDDDDFKHP